MTEAVIEAVSSTTEEQPKLRRKTRPATGDLRYGRSAITNGRRMHTPFNAGEAAWSRRFKDIYKLLVGNADNKGVRQLARRVATISFACEKMESEAAAGHDFDHQLYGMYTDQLGRTLQCLGLKQQQKEGANK
jgi:hypothetical protein